jgi:hypothetical protein
MNDVLGYLTDTATQAEATCKQLHPNPTTMQQHRTSKTGVTTPDSAITILCGG